MSLFLVCVLTFIGALGILVAYAYEHPVPVSADAAYYLMVAENIYGGRGLVSDYVWNYLGGLPRGLPVPSNDYWMPGTSVVMALAFSIAQHVSLRAAQWPSLVFGALFCAITAWMAGLIFNRRDVAGLAGIACAINYFAVGLALFPDHFMLNAVLVNLSLLALWGAWRGVEWLATPAGILAALAYLTRSDGALLVIVALIIAIGLRRRGRRARALGLAVQFTLAFALVALPWWVRQTFVFGHLSGANPMRTAFLTDYNDLFRLDQSRLNLRDYLASSQTVALGIKGYMVFRGVRMLARAVMVFGLLACGGLFLRDLRRQMLPWLVYLCLGLLVPALIVPYPAGKGGQWHLMPALLPAVIALGAATAVHLLNRGRQSGRPGAVLAGWTAVALGLGSLLYWWARPPADADRAAEPLYPAVAAKAVQDLGANRAPALTDSAWGLYHAARLPCAQFPTDGAGAALKIADAIGARYLIARADATRSLPKLAEVVNHPRFKPLARYPAGETSLLVYRIVPGGGTASHSPSARRRRISQ